MQDGWPPVSVFGIFPAAWVNLQSAPFRVGHVMSPLVVRRQERAYQQDLVLAIILFLARVDVHAALVLLAVEGFVLHQAMDVNSCLVFIR